MKNTQLWLIGATTQINLQDPATGMYLDPDITGLLGLPSIRTSQGVNVGKDGGWTSAQFYGPRVIAIKGIVANGSIATVESLRLALVTLLAEKNLLLKFVTEAGATYTTRVVLIDSDFPMQQMLRKQNYQIQLKADDPLLYDFNSEGGDLVAIITVRQPSGGFVIPFTFPLAITGSEPTIAVPNSGTSSVSPIITLQGPLHQPTIVNLTTNQQMQILADLSPTDVVVINTQLNTITINGVDAYYLKADGSQFIDIAPGTNQMYLTSDNTGDTGYAEVRYNSGFIGI